MRPLQVFLYPDYFNGADAALLSPVAFGELSTIGIELQWVHWNGKVSSLPKNQGVVVVGNNLLYVESRENFEEILEACFKLQHFFLYYDEYICNGDMFPGEKMLAKLHLFLKQNAT